ncbi:small nuclear ribonucleoprotein D2 [Nematocida sp. AWRm77]|nr:small nuclear ribonucleoprotein D2 [Nematocida sp. AWRm77]
MDLSPLKYLAELAQACARVHVSNRNGRDIEGILHSVDKHFNLLLREATETKVQLPSTRKGKKRKTEKVFKRELGNVFIRGDTVVSLSTLKEHSKESQINSV